MPTVTENWSGRKHTPGKSAQRVFVVSYDSTDLASATEPGAEAACYSLVVGGFPLEPALLPQAPTAVRLGPVVFEVTWPFKPAPDPAFSGDPLFAPPTFENDVGNFTDFCEYDIDGNAKTNSVGDPFDPTPTREFTVEFLKVTKWLTLAQLAAAKAFQDTVNSDTINIPIFPDPIRPGELNCLLVKPVEAIDATMSKAQCVFLFRYRKGRFEMSNGIWDSWQSRYLDTGLMGFDGDGEKDLFYTHKGQLPSHPLLLDGNGVPLDPPNPNIKVGLEGTPTANPDPTPGEIDDTGGFGVFIVYQDLEAKDYSALGIF